MDSKTESLISQAIYLHNLTTNRGRILQSTVPSLIENLPPHLKNTISLTDIIDMQKYLISFQSPANTWFEDENKEGMQKTHC